MTEDTCGLMDWGSVGQIDLVTALSSCLTFAEPDFVIDNLDYSFERFAREFEAPGGGPLLPLLTWSLVLWQHFAPS